MASSQFEESGPVFFWNCGQPNDFLSQWYPVRFTAPSPDKSEPPMTFFHTEQYMMYHKAILFEDSEIAEKIMETQKPAQIKALGRKVKGFDGKKWDAHREKIVEEGNWNKFINGEEQGLKRKLLNTGDRKLVEASPKDRIWGVGYDAEHAQANKTNWGENLLGKALMRVRARVMEAT